VAYSLELGKHIRGWLVLGHDPECQEESEEAEDVQEQYNPFSKRQVLRKEDVEADGQEDEQEDDQCCFPQLTRRVSRSEARIWVHERDHVLYYAGQLNAARRDACDPA